MYIKIGGDAMWVNIFDLSERQFKVTFSRRAALAAPGGIESVARCINGICLTMDCMPAAKEADLIDICSKDGEKDVTIMISIEGGKARLYEIKALNEAQERPKKSTNKYGWPRAPRVSPPPFIKKAKQ